MAAKWRRCDRCRKVLPVEQFEAEAGTCRGCLTTPRRRDKPPAAPIVRTAGSPTGPRRPVDLRGKGDTEVRRRRAREAALRELADRHAEEFAGLLLDAERAEGLGPAAHSEAG